jgi:hypothetical protein
MAAARLRVFIGVLIGILAIACGLFPVTADSADKLRVGYVHVFDDLRS